LSAGKTIRDKKTLHSINRLESVLSKLQNISADNCEFNDICPYFNAENYTCANNGGSHCGKYRKLVAEKVKK